MRLENGDYVPLEKYIERIFAERQRADDQLFEARKESLRLAAANLEHHLEVLNHAQAQHDKDQSDFVRSHVYLQAHAEVSRRIDGLEKWQARLVGVGIILIVLLPLLGMFISHVLKW